MMTDEKLGGLVGLKADVPEVLRRRVRAAAALEGMQMRDFIKEALVEKLERVASGERRYDSHI